MTFAWIDYLAVARELVAPGRASPPEACQRASIGRAYYAVFGYALQVFVELGEYVPVRNGDDHSALARQLNMSPEPRRREIGVILDRLRPARRWADYVIGPPPRRDLFQTGAPACSKAQRAIDLIGQVAATPEAR